MLLLEGGTKVLLFKEYFMAIVIKEVLELALN
jgi:hypothetical protein